MKRNRFKIETVGFAIRRGIRNERVESIMAPMFLVKATRRIVMSFIEIREMKMNSLLVVLSLKCLQKISKWSYQEGIGYII